MSQDLRRTVAKSGLYKQEYPRDKWAPGSWQAAAAYHAVKPEVRCPVVLGGDSMFGTPEELRDFSQLSHVPVVKKTIRSTFRGFPNGKAPEPVDEHDVIQVMDISQREVVELKKRTQGTMILVWFGGKPRYAWVPRSANPESRPASTAEAQPATKAPPTTTVITENAPGSTVVVDPWQQQSTLPQQPAPDLKEAASPPATPPQSTNSSSRSSSSNRAFPPNNRHKNQVGLPPLSTPKRPAHLPLKTQHNKAPSTGPTR